MPNQLQPKEQRYFWSGWFTGQSFFILAMLYLILSFADLYATIRLLGFDNIAGNPLGTREGNPLANWVLVHYGIVGFAMFKILLVFVVLGVIKLIERQRLRVAHILLWAANIIMAYVAILHITIMIATIYLHSV